MSNELIDGSWLEREASDDSGVMYAGGEGCTTAYPEPAAPRSTAKDVGVVGSLTIVACQSTKTDGCGDSPCGANGRCVTDPCDPHQNAGDFSKCRYEGTGSSLSAAASSTAKVTWTYDHAVGDDVYLVPSGAITGTSSLPLCTVSPLTYGITSAAAICA